VNSWNAAPGEMPYDDDGPRPNCVCPDCGARFSKPRADQIGDRCDACADAAWMREQDRRREVMETRMREQLRQLQALLRG
jgi:hypothetical protein